jgi:predicted ATPase
LDGELRLLDSFQEISGCSEAIKRVLCDVATVASTNATVLVEGETGAGKERIARAVHDLSTRREKNFTDQESNMTTSSLGTPFLQDAPGPAAAASEIRSGAESSGYVLVPLREGADFTL